jgi:hypothetical protein
MIADCDVARAMVLLARQEFPGDLRCAQQQFPGLPLLLGNLLLPSGRCEFPFSCYRSLPVVALLVSTLLLPVVEFHFHAQESNRAPSWRPGREREERSTSVVTLRQLEIAGVGA